MKIAGSALSKRCKYVVPERGSSPVNGESQRLVTDHDTRPDLAKNLLSGYYTGSIANQIRE